MSRTLLLAGGAALLALLAFAGTAQAETVVNGGTISTDTTWTLAGSPYLVKGSVTVLGSAGADGVTTLTIEPGVEVRFHAATTLTVSGTSSLNRGALDARGTELAPIVFTSNQTVHTRGFWNSIVVQPFANDTLTFLENVTVEYAGGVGNVHLNQAEPTIRNAIFRESSTYGLQLSSSNARIESSSFSANTDSGVFTSTLYPTFVAPTFSGNGKYGLYTNSGVPTLQSPTFSANGYRPARLQLESPLTAPVFSGSLTHEIEIFTNTTHARDLTLPLHLDTTSGLPLKYVLVTALTMAGQAGPDLVTTLTIEPGVELRFGSGVALTIGATTASQPGALDARGTAALPIVLTSNQSVQTRGFWGGVTFQNFASDTLTILENVTIEYATTGATINSASFPIRDSTFRRSSNHGLQVSTGAGAFDRIVLDNNTGSGANLASYTGTITGVVATANTANGILLTGDATIVDLTASGNGQYGFQATSGKPQLLGASFDNNGNRPLRIHVDSNTSGLTFSKSQVPEIEFQATPTATMVRDRSWPTILDAFNGTEHRYAVLSSFTVQGQDGGDLVTTLTLEPGVEVRFGSGVGITIGTTTASQPGALDARGTAADPILLTSNQVGAKTRGFWAGVTFNSFASDGLSAIENATIEYGGGNGNLFFSGATIPVKRSTIANASGPGIQVQTGDGAFEELAVVDNSGSGLLLTTYNGRVNDSTIARNGQHGISLSGTSGQLNRLIVQQNALYGIQITGGIYRIDDVDFVANGQRPLRMHVESELVSPSFDANGILEIELVSNPTSTLTKDRTLPIQPNGGNLTPHAYVVLGSFTVQGTDGADGVTTLTIDPGAQLRFASGTALTVGTASIPGALVAQGTEAAPIVFTSNQVVKTRGFWGGITFNNAASDAISRVENVTVSHGGGNGNLFFSSATVRVTNANVHNASGPGIQVSTGNGPIDHVSVVDNTGAGLLLTTYNGNVTDAIVARNGQHGIQLSGTSGTLARLAVQQNAQYGIQIASGIYRIEDVDFVANGQRPLRMHVESELLSSTFDGNGILEVEIMSAPTSTLTKDRTLPILTNEGNLTPHVYVMLGTFTVQGTDGADGVTTLTIAPGAELRFGSGVGLSIGTTTTTPGALVAQGTEVAPIVFTSNQVVKTRGFWAGITFNNGASDTLTILENVTVTHGGGNGNLFFSSASIRVRDATVHNASGPGIQVSTGNGPLEAITSLDNAGSGFLLTSFNGNLTDSAARRNAQHGVSLSGTSGTLARLTVQQNTQYGIQITSGVYRIEDVAFLANGQRPLRMHVESELAAPILDANGIPEIELVSAPTSTLTKDRTFPVLTDATNGSEHVYVVLATFTVQGTDGADGSTTMTVAPGAEFRFASGAGINVATPVIPGALDARGTELDPIVFTSNQAVKTRGFWGSVSFAAATAEAQSFVENVTLSHGGSSGNLVLNGANVPLRAVLSHNASGPGINVATGSGAIVDATVVDNTGNGLQLTTYTGSVLDSTLARNGGHGISLSGTNVVLQALQVERNAQYGIQITSGIHTIDGVTFSMNGQRPLRMHVESALTNAVFEGNGVAEIELVSAPTSTLTATRTLPVHLDTVNGTRHPYIVVGGFTIQGPSASLTLDPGVELRFNSGQALAVGTSTLNGTLVAAGTAADPILLTSNQVAKTRGFWGGLSFANFASDADSRLENVTIEYASTDLSLSSASPTVRNAVFRQASQSGVSVSTSASELTNVSLLDNAQHGLTGSYAGTMTGCAATNNSFSGLSLTTDATIRDCVVARNRQYGIHTSSGVLTLDNVTIEDNLGAPLRMHVASSLTGVAFDGNGIGQIELHGALLWLDRTFARHVDLATNAPIPYVVNQSFSVYGNDGPDGVSTLTIEPGVTMRFSSATDLTIAASGANVGALDARGTSALPILLTSNQVVKTRGFWGPLTFSPSTSDTLTRVENVTVEYGGRTSAGILLSSAELTFRNVLVRENNNVGIQVNVGYLRLHDSVIDRSASHGLLVSAGGASLVDVAIESSGGKPIRSTIDLDLDGLMVENNTGSDIEIFASSGTHDARWPVVVDNSSAILPYNVTGTVTLGGAGTPTLTIAPGVEVRMGSAAWFSVGNGATQPAALVARATAAQPILFTSNQATHTPGFWRGIEIGDFAADGTTILENVTIEYGGFASSGGIAITASAPLVRDSTIRFTTTYGIYVNNGRPGLDLYRNAISNVTTGIYLTGATSLVNVVENNVSAQTPISLTGADDTLIERNTFASTSGSSNVGTGSAGNRIWDNVFTRPTGAPLSVNATGNLFNRTRTPGTSILGGPYLGGNSYSDYTGIDWTNPSDGLGDDPAPYAIAGSAAARDQHPLVDVAGWIPDLDDPTTFANITGPLLPSGWYNGTARVRLDATDARSGVAFITRILDNVTNASAGNTVFHNVSAQGWHVLDYFATDNATNVEATQRIEFGVDSIAPALNLTLDPRIDDLCFLPQATDAGSGVALVTYTVTDANNSVVTNSTGVQLLNVTAVNGATSCADLSIDGSFRVTARARDHAGHARENRSALVTLDLVGPLIDLVHPAPGALYIGNTRVATPYGNETNASVVVLGVEVVANATDAGSGVALVALYLDGLLVASDTHAPLRYRLENVTAGLHEIRVVAIDGAGHEANETRTVLFLTTMPPELVDASVRVTFEPPMPEVATSIAPRSKVSDVASSE